jgi:hypothetical protein
MKKTILEPKYEYLFFAVKYTEPHGDFRPDMPPGYLGYWPRITQISYSVYTKDGILAKTEHYITNGVCNQDYHYKTKELHINDVLVAFQKDLSTVKYMISHDMQLQSNLVLSEILRSKDIKTYYVRKKICLMHGFTDLVALSGFNGYRNPNLVDIQKFCDIPESNLPKYSAAFDLTIIQHGYFWMKTHNIIPKQNNDLKLKFTYCSWNFPKMFDSSERKGTFKHINIELYKFSSLFSFTRREPPYENTYIALKKGMENLFQQEITKFIIEPHKTVSEIKFGTVSTGSYLFNSDLKKCIIENTFFKVPTNNNEPRTYKKGRFLQFFRTLEFDFPNKIVEPIFHEEVGYTGKTRDEFLKGVELVCDISLEASTKLERDFIFIKDVTIEHTFIGGEPAQFYIIPIDLGIQANDEINRLLKKYPNAKSIVCKNDMFGAEITELNIKAWKSVSNIVDVNRQVNACGYAFQKSINRYFMLSYTKEYGTVLEEKIRGRKTLFGSKFNMPSLTQTQLDDFMYDDPYDRFIDDFSDDL